MRWENRYILILFLIFADGLFSTLVVEQQVHDCACMFDLLFPGFFTLLGFVEV